MGYTLVMRIPSGFFLQDFAKFSHYKVDEAAALKS